MPTFTKESWVRGMVTRDGKWDNPLTGDRRRSNARRRRGLEKDFGGEVSVVDRTHDPEAMADFLRLEASGWKGRGDGTAYGVILRRSPGFEIGVSGGPRQAG